MFGIYLFKYITSLRFYRFTLQKLQTEVCHMVCVETANRCLWVPAAEEFLKYAWSSNKKPLAKMPPPDILLLALVSLTRGAVWPSWRGFWGCFCFASCWSQWSWSVGSAAGFGQVSPRFGESRTNPPPSGWNGRWLQPGKTRKTAMGTSRGWDSSCLEAVHFLPSSNYTLLFFSINSNPLSISIQSYYSQ